MSDIDTKCDVHGGNKIVIELNHYNADGANDKPFDIAEIYVIREKTEKAEEEKMSALKIYGDDNKKIKIEILCKE